MEQADNTRCSSWRSKEPRKAKIGSIRSKEAEFCCSFCGTRTWNCSNHNRYRWRPINGVIDESSGDRSKGQVRANIKECPNCQELYTANQQLRDALKVHASATTDKQIAQKCSEDYLEFELSVPFRPLLRHMLHGFESNKDMDRVSLVRYVGKINVQTRKVVDVRWFYV